MALEVNFKEGGNTVVIPGAVEVRDEGDGRISIKLLTQPNRSWVDNKYGRVPNGASMTFAGRRNYLPDAYDGLFDTNDHVRFDPHRYINGSKLGFSESVTRATDKVYSNTQWWGSYNDDVKGSKRDLAKIVYEIIDAGKGRDTIYRLGAKADTLYDENVFHDANLVRLFELAALYEGAITEPVLAK